MNYPEPRRLDPRLRAKWRRQGYYIVDELSGYRVLVGYEKSYFCRTLNELEARMAHELTGCGKPLKEAAE